MTPHHYILDKEGNARQATLMEWAKWMEKKERVVKQEWIDDIFVSTVFLGIDHNFEEGPPILWETMAFKKCEPETVMGLTVTKKEIACDRCSGNREQAEAMHQRMVLRVEEGEIPCEDAI